MRVAVALIAIATATSACSENELESEKPSASLASLTMSFTPASIGVGEMMQGTVKGYDANGRLVATGPVKWSSTGAVTAYAKGLVIANFEGTSSITATAGGLSVERRMQVASKPAVRVSSIEKLLVRKGVPFSLSAGFVTVDNQGVVIGGAEMTSKIEGASPESRTAKTTPFGFAVFENIVLNGASGKRAFTISSEGFAPATGTITVVSGVAKTVMIVAGNNQTGVKGTGAGAVTALVTDEDGYPVAKVPVTFLVASGGGLMTNPTVLTADDGTASTAGWTLGAVGVNTLSVSAVGVTAPAIVTATALPRIQRVELTFSAPTVPVGNTVQGSLAVFDDAGAPYVLPTTIDWLVQSNSFALVTPTGVVTGTSAGTANIIVRVNGVTTSAFLTVTGTPTQKLVTGPMPTVVKSGAPLDDFVSVQLTNAATNQPVAESGRTVTVALVSQPPAGARLIGQTTATTDASGMARFSGLGVIARNANLQLLFRAAGVAPATGNVFTTAGAAFAIAVVGGDNQSGVAGEATTTRPSVRIVDEAGNTVPSGIPVTFTVSAGGGRVTNGTVLTDDNGIATVGAWTLGNVGTNTLVVSAPGIVSTVLFTAIAKPF